MKDVAHETTASLSYARCWWLSLRLGASRLHQPLCNTPCEHLATCSILTSACLSSLILKHSVHQCVLLPFSDIGLQSTVGYTCSQPLNRHGYSIPCSQHFRLLASHLVSDFLSFFSISHKLSSQTTLTFRELTENQSNIKVVSTYN